ncbi:hypothetical protein [Peptostreptococcus anaerobius]|uniref:hypothetical protein n=1 Tax=Peptostreptococcus anaerobius TaxID=1261 RepID=UPI00189B0CED|nr:hypothetical protein [Peptostreptococcus anaerobius]MDB8852113.1 hypothetical protein [Peptostreptococcus anaerobius]
MKQYFFTPEFLYASLSSEGVEYVVKNYNLEFMAEDEDELSIGSYRIIGINPQYFRNNTSTTCFLVLIGKTTVKLFAEHIESIWDCMSDGILPRL